MYMDRMRQRSRLAQSRANPTPDAVEMAAAARLHESYSTTHATRNEDEPLPGEFEQPTGLSESDQPGQTSVEDSLEMQALRQENAALNKRLAMLEKQLADNINKAKLWAQQQGEYESLLEEKSELIRELHLKLQESPAKPTQAAPSTPREEEILALHEQLEDERQQLQQDEEALQQQMRDMELQMSRERAEMARQKIELQRLHDELKMELEMAARESNLRERLAPLQRKHSDLIHRRGLAPNQQKQQAAPQVPEAAAKPVQSSGLFRRLFGQQE